MISLTAEKLPNMHSTTFRGMPVVIEWPKGSVRVGEDKDGKKWKRDMKADYGYVPDTTATGDRENLDVYIGPNEDAEYAYIVEQLKEDGSFDEYKVMLGFDSLEEAEKTYLAHYPEDWESTRLGDVAEVPFEYLFDMVDDHLGGIEKQADVLQMEKPPKTKEQKGEGKLLSFPAAKPKVEPEPESGPISFEMAQGLEDSDPPKAYKMYERLFQQDPTDARLPINMGTIVFAQGDRRKAKELYEKAIALDPEWPVAHFNLANVLEEIGPQDEAIQSYQTALKLAPNYSDCMFNLGLLYKRRNDGGKALPLLRNFLKFENIGQDADHARQAIKDITRKLRVVSSSPWSAFVNSRIATFKAVKQSDAIDDRLREEFAKAKYQMKPAEGADDKFMYAAKEQLGIGRDQWDNLSSATRSEIALLAQELKMKAKNPQPQGA